MFSNLFVRKSSIIEIDSIGPVLLEKSKRARRLTISIRPFKGIRVSIPYGMSFTRAEEFVRSKVKWIAKHRQRIKRVEIEQQNFKDGSVQIDRQEASRILINRLNELARQNGFLFNKVSIRSQTTRWGSCSVKNNINLNLKLVRLPQHFIDYVILHELVHTKIKNHSLKFWNELANYIPDPKSVGKELRKYGVDLI